ncbi:MAG TPA: SDR family NAD(P)-dependent oxidoreductase [Burkholderiales bacterium]|nr:SDR family NAD(P)-dependent oxidoreductase [Burkholderiales bacterium]
MKQVLVTGATDGIGRETARQLLVLGHRVLVHGRNDSKAHGTAEALAKETGSDAAAVWGDLSRMREVVALADQIKASAPALDVLISNAGVYEQRRLLTTDGFELTMAVNHFAPFLLVHHLLDALERAPVARVVVVASMVHQGAQIDLDDLTFERGYSGYDAYATSKLANVLFTRELARRLRAKGDAITANALHPGVISTKLLHRGFGAGGAPVGKGAKTSVYLALSDEVQGVTGKYFVDCRETKPSRLALDDTLAEALWQESSELLRPYLGSV